MAAESTDLQHGAVITRDAHLALRELKKLVDEATEKIRAAEFETVDLAMGRKQESHSRDTLQTATQTLRSPRFQAALQRALAKLEIALAWHSPGEKGAHSN